MQTVYRTLRYRLAAFTLAVGVLLLGGYAAQADLPVVFGKQMTADPTVDNLCLYGRGSNPQCLPFAQVKSGTLVGALLSFLDPLGRRPVTYYYQPGSDNGDYAPAFQRSLNDQGLVYAPARLGPYTMSTGVVSVADGQTVSGDGSGNAGTVIKVLSATGDLFTVTDNGTIAGFYVDAASGVTRTAGCYVRFNGQNTGRGRLTDFQFWHAFNGACTGATTTSITRGQFYSTVNWDVDVSFGFNHYIDNITNGALSTAQPKACIHISQSGDVTITNSRLLLCGEAVLADVGNGQYISSLVIADSFLDTNGVRALHLRSSGTGNIVRARFNNDWFGNSINEGILIENLGTGKIDDLQFVAPLIEFNGLQGLKTVGPLPNLKLEGPVVGSNGIGTMYNGPNNNDLPYTLPAAGAACGLDLSSQTDIRVSNPMIGATSEMSGNNCPLTAASGATGSFIGGKITANNNPMTDNSGSGGIRFIDVNGIVTHNRFAYSIPSGTGTSGGTAFSHGMTFQPARGDWLLSIDQSLAGTGATRCWLGNPTSSQLTPYCDATTSAAILATVDIEPVKGRSY